MSLYKTHASPLDQCLSSYGISHNGFLPEKDPLRRLPQSYYAPWEAIMARLPGLVETAKIRCQIDQMPVLTTAYLDTEPEWARAYSILAFMAQGYIWSGPQPSDRLPPAITVPFLAVCSHLQLQPIASYAGLNLWNWRRRDVDITKPQNLQTIHTISGTKDESWFLVISIAMEASAGPLIETMLEAIEAVQNDVAHHVIVALTKLRQGLIEISELLQRMDEECDPQVFYHQVRPLLAGSRNMQHAGLPNGVFYDEGDGKGQWRKMRGGSNGQSSLLQLFDAVLGVKHYDKEAFHQEMRTFMPRTHAKLIADVESIANIRQYVAEHKDHTELTDAYNGAVRSLSSFRDQHIRIATRYVILPSRMASGISSPPKRSLGLTSQDPTQSLVGTGGTKLVPFLRQARDETLAAAVGVGC